MKEQSRIPLMPNEALRYYSTGNESKQLFERAMSMRFCLENLVETIFNEFEILFFPSTM